MINKAQGYRNEVIPKAKGEAVQMIQRAEGAKVDRIKRAEGDVQKFTMVLKQYRKAKDVTRRRLYIETMEAVLPAAKKIILTEPGQVSLLNLLSNEVGSLTPAKKGTGK